VIHSLRRCIETLLPSAPIAVKLKRFVAQSYIGLFLEEDGPAWFREVMKNFATECKRHGVYIIYIHVCNCHEFAYMQYTVYYIVVLCFDKLKLVLVIRYCRYTCNFNLIHYCDTLLTLHKSSL